MYFQYEEQKQGEVTRILSRSAKINPGDKVLLFNQNKYYGHSTFEETEIESTFEKTLNNQIKKKLTTR